MAQVQQLTPAQQAAANQQKMLAQNAQARALVLSQGYPMMQQIASGTFNPANNQIINIAPQNVGLIKGFIVEIVAQITAGAALTLSGFGPANVLQRVQFADLQNYTRINTAGYQLSFLNSRRNGRPFGSSTPSDSPIGFGSNVSGVAAPATLANAATGTVRMMYWVPIAFSHTDLSGAIYGAVVNATMNLQLQFSTSAQFSVAAGADPLGAVYTGGAATVNSYTYTVYQSYLDQLPATNDGIILPQLDLNTMYEIKDTFVNGLSAGQDLLIGYSNFRRFLSTCAVFDNGGSFNAGTDVNYWSFRTANYTDSRKADPYIWKLQERQRIQTDFPKGVYMFDTSDKPIYTTQTGNMALVLNPSTVNAGAQVLLGYEMLSNVNALTNAGSLQVA